MANSTAMRAPRIALLQCFDGCERLGDMLAEVEVVVDHDDPALAIDHVGGARGDPGGAAQATS